MELKQISKSLINSFLTGTVITLVLSTILVGGCNLGDEAETACGICGKYERKENPEIFLLINSDGTFNHKSPEPWSVTCVLTGNWEKEGDTLLLIWPGCDYTVELYLQGTTIIYNDETGSFVYTKKDEQ